MNKSMINRFANLARAPFTGARLNRFADLACVALAAAIGLAAALLTGCSTTKTRSIDIAGMYGSDSGQIAIGSVKVQAIEQGTVAAIVNYEEDNAWLAPSMKLHNIGITLTGTNSVEKADAIVRHICEAFVSVAPSLKGEAPATTLYEQQMKRAELKEAAKALKSTQPDGAATTAATTAASAACENCADGSCSYSGGTITAADCDACTNCAPK